MTNNNLFNFAENLCRKILNLQKETLTANNSEIGTTMYNLAGVLNSLNRII